MQKLKKQVIHVIFIKANQIKFAFKIITYGDFQDLHRRAASDKILCDKAFNIVKNLK